MSSLECSLCIRSFSRRSSLNRHTKLIHGEKKTFKCDACNHSFSRNDALLRHSKCAHPKKEFISEKFFSNSTTYFECFECGMRFQRKDILKLHLHKKHGDKEFECNDCNAKFKYKQNLAVHCSKAHSNHNPPISLQKCAFCECSFTTYNSCIQHYEVDHAIQIKKEKLYFNNKEEFKSFKKQLEESTNSSFIIVSKYKTSTVIFRCHRSGKYETKSKGIRRTKLKGTKKLGFLCPAELRVHFGMRRISVTYQSTHIGHDLSTESESGFLYLHKDDRAVIASKISSGVPLDRIIKDKQNETVLSNYLQMDLKRMDLLRNKDLHNIERTYNIKSGERTPRPFTNDVDNVGALLKRYEESVLYYKKQHELPDNRFPMLKKEDIVIIIMCQSQKVLLEKHGSNVIAMDGTHGMNNYHFILHTLLVLDYDGEGYPVAFAISNLNNELLIDVFLTCIKNKVGVITAQTVMTDMQLSYINSWRKIMTPPKYHLFCIWHVYEAWRKNSNKIQHKEKRRKMLESLYQLSRERNEENFKSQLMSLIRSDDNDTAPFLKYFMHEYGKNFKRWAYCYRLHAGVNTNMHLEAFHRSLKYIHGNGRKIKDLYTGLNVIFDYLQSKLTGIVNKYIRGAIPQKLRFLREAHGKCLKYIEENGNANVEKFDNGWLVETTEIYFVQKIRDKCPAIEDPDYKLCNLECTECGSCAHLYNCTCIENAVKNNMCKHIHIALTTSKKLLENVNSSDVNVMIEPIIPASTQGQNEQIDSDANIDDLRNRIRENLENVLKIAVTSEQLKAVDKLMKPIIPTILSMSSTVNQEAQSFVKKCKEKGEQIKKQKRIYG